MAGDTTVELARVPATGPVYRRAALGLLARNRGDALPDTTLVVRDVDVDRSRLARYARVCGFDLTDRLPGPYPHVLAFPLAMHLMSAGDFPFPVVGLVHVANRIEQLRPIGAHERLDIAVHAADLRAHERGRQFDVLASASVGAELVWRGVSTYLRRQSTPDGGGRTPRERGEPPTPTAIWQVGRDVGGRYADVSGDHNPIHTSWLGARAFGFPRPIAHGMWSMARCLAALANRLADEYTAEVAFKRPILLPATVAFTASRSGTGWSLSVVGAKSGTPHLTGEVRQAFS